MSEHTATATAHPRPRQNNYLKVWGALMVSLALLVGISMIGDRTLTVPLILLVATANAYLMFSQFMHMPMEPRYVKWLILSATVTILWMLFALLPDIAWKFGNMPLASSEQTAGSNESGGHPGSEHGTTAVPSPGAGGPSPGAEGGH